MVCGSDAAAAPWPRRATWREPTVNSSPTPPTAAPPIDRPSLVERCMGDPAFACLILGKFAARAAEMVAAVERAVASADAAAVGRAAHSLKGAAANLSAEGVRAAAAAIEAVGHGGDAAAAGPLLAALRFEMDRCLAHVPVLVAELQRGPTGVAA